MTTEGVGWSSEEASDLVAPPLNLVLYMHLRIFAYTSNALIASFEYMELILASGTLKNFRFLLRSRFVHRSCARDKADLFYLPALSLYHRTDGAPEGSVLVLGCTLGPDEVSFADVGHSLVLQNTKGPGRIAYGWEDRYSVRPHPPETFLHDCFSWNPLCDSSIFHRCEGASHFTGSYRVPYRLLCQIQVLYIFKVGCDFVPDSLEAFLA